MAHYRIRGKSDRAFCAVIQPVFQRKCASKLLTAAFC
ncbi:Uncharacterised protein [Vibrio cholerae]|nr:Uncharacterised protein [Vibrio cholerae]CSI46862.1 Uncharacterised protein [Vibrio cholerae]CSI53502.1 Uncharacterised protein [Vibrio cholerae]